MKIYIGNDHGGVALKNKIIETFAPKGYEFVNLGTDTTEIVRYPYYAEQVAKHVEQDPESRGILICSTGIGMSMAANKFKGIRAALCTDPYMAKMTRKHNNSNVLCLGGRVLGPGLANELVDAFLDTSFEGGRHARRVAQIMAIQDGELTE